MLSASLEDLGLHSVHAVSDEDNRAIIRVLSKCGLWLEGRMLQRGKSRPEAKEPYFDQFGYAILREKWIIRREQKEKASVLSQISAE